MTGDDDKYPKLELIVATDENLGIGKDGKLPWNLPTESAYFEGITARNRGQGKVRHHLIYSVERDQDGTAEASSFLPIGPRVHLWSPLLGVSGRACRSTGRAPMEGHDLLRFDQ